MKKRISTLIFAFLLFVAPPFLTFGQQGGNALKFEGTHDYFSLGTGLSFPGTNPFTIEAGVNRNTGRT